MEYIILTLVFVGLLLLAQQNEYNTTLIKITNTIRVYQPVLSVIYFVIVITGIAYGFQVDTVKEFDFSVLLTFALTILYIGSFVFSLRASKNYNLDLISYLPLAFCVTYFGLKLIKNSYALNGSSVTIGFILGLLSFTVPVYAIAVSTNFRDNPYNSSYVSEKKQKEYNHMSSVEKSTLARMEDQEDFYLDIVKNHHNARAIINYIEEVDIHNRRDANAKADVEKYINLVEDNNLIRNKYNMPLKNPYKILRDVAYSFDY